MVRYKRYRRRKYGNSTRVIKMKIQSFMDISTSANSMQILTISAGGKNIIQRLGPQFGAYKYYKIGNIAVKLVPASTLPVDPTGLSIAAGDNLVDPRDQLTPGMMRITNGEDVFENISGLTDDQQRGIYNNMLLDPRWFKWMLQSGVKRHATPRYWQIGQLHQDKWPGAITNVPAWSQDGTSVAGTVAIEQDFQSNVGYHENVGVYGSSAHGLFQTGHRGVLGWLPTDGLDLVGLNGSMSEESQLASPPEVEVFKILLPKSYKTRYWYRMFITETVFFKEPIVNFGIFADDGYSYRPLDVFHLPNQIIPIDPDAGQSVAYPTDDQTGGNYGNH